MFLGNFIVYKCIHIQFIYKWKLHKLISATIIKINQQNKYTHKYATIKCDDVNFRMCIFVLCLQFESKKRNRKRRPKERLVRNINWICVFMTPYKLWWMYSIHSMLEYNKWRFYHWFHRASVEFIKYDGLFCCCI